MSIFSQVMASADVPAAAAADDDDDDTEGSF